MSILILIHFTDLIQGPLVLPVPLCVYSVVYGFITCRLVYLTPLSRYRTVNFKDPSYCLYNHIHLPPDVLFNLWGIIYSPFPKSCHFKNVIEMESYSMCVTF